MIVDLNSRECGGDDGVRIMASVGRDGYGGTNFDARKMIFIGDIYYTTICKGLWVNMDGYLSVMMHKFYTFMIGGWYRFHGVNPWVTEENVEG